MADADDVCRLALALPHVVEIDSDGFDFRLPLVMLRLERVSVERLEELITDAWRMRAPESLVGDLEDAS